MRSWVMAAVVPLFWCVPALAAESIIVKTVERKPFSFQTEQGWTGFSIELLDIIAERRNWTVSYQPSENFPDMLDAVRRSEVDMAVANISITFAREREMDFSQPIFDAGLIVMTPTGGGANVFEVLFSRDLLLWVGGAIGLLFLAGALIWWVERRPGNVNDNDYDDGKIGGVGEGVWWAVNVVTQAGFEISSPKTRGGRFIAFTLILTGLFAVSAFVAQITAALTVQELTSKVTGLRDLDGKRVGTTTGSTSAEYMDAHFLPYRDFPTMEALFEALKAGELDAVVHDAPMLAYFASNEGQGRFRLVGRIFKSEKYGFALSERHPLAEVLNQTLLQVREDGSYDQLVAKWFGKDY